MNYPSIKSRSNERWHAAIAAELLPNRFWQVLPTCCFLSVLFATLLLSEINISASISWGQQSEAFLGMNQALSAISLTIWSELTMLGDALVLIPILALLLLKRPRAWVAIVYAAPMAGLVTYVLKKLFEAPRPGAMLDPSLFHFVGSPLTGHNSFPSGHTATAFVFIFAVLCSLYPSPKRYHHRAIVVVGIGLAVLVGLSRVAIGVHWPLDIVLGAGIGTAAAFIGARLAVLNPASFLRLPVCHRVASWIPAVLGAVLIYRGMTEEAGLFMLWSAAFCGMAATALLQYQRWVWHKRCSVK